MVKTNIEVGGQVYQVSFYYDKGGQYRYNSKRGFYGSIRPITITSHDGFFVTKSYSGDGVNVFLSEVSRYSKKAEKEAGERFRRYVSERLGVVV